MFFKFLQSSKKIRFQVQAAASDIKMWKLRQKYTEEESSVQLWMFKGYFFVLAPFLHF